MPQVEGKCPEETENPAKGMSLSARFAAAGRGLPQRVKRNRLFKHTVEIK
jgi:hypothetical protein